MPRFAFGVTALLSIAATDALAATPNPDRPSFSRTGVLVAHRSAETEVGLNWSPAMPGLTVMPKLGLGRFEPRANLALTGSSFSVAPGMKVGIVQTSGLGIAGHIEVGLGADQRPAEVGALATGTLAGGQTLQANVGVRTELGASGAVLQDMPIAGLVGFPIGKRASVYGEAVALLQNATSPTLFGSGFSIAVLDNCILDSGVSWSPGSQVVSATAGATVNLGGRN